jgi:pimeloyl-ACP methyl ester carboxylesterase
MTWRSRTLLTCVVVTLLSVAALQWVPAIGAGALLHPVRSVRSLVTPPGCTEQTFNGSEIDLRGWHCKAAGTRRGSVVILHGVADSRASVAGMVERFSRKGLDLVTYDSRAHGQSGGEFCTYGYFEKADLRRVIQSLPQGPVVLMGTSLGAAVALQGAADDPRVSGVVAAEVFADLKSIARDRTPAFVPDWVVGRAFRAAELRAGFDADAVSPLRAARSITIPVLLIHGARDTATSPDHSKRVLEALRGPKRLILVDGAGHNESLRDAGAWNEIDNWIDALVR